MRKVMILDDNILDAMNAAKFLTAAQYEIIKMSTPHGALAKLEFEQPDILLLDITMARLNIQGFLQTLQNEDPYEELIIVLFSDLDAETLQKYCVENDIHGYYCKSMDISKLPEFLNHFYEDE